MNQVARTYLVILKDVIVVYGALAVLGTAVGIGENIAGMYRDYQERKRRKWWQFWKFVHFG